MMRWLPRFLVVAVLLFIESIHSVLSPKTNLSRKSTGA